MLVSQFSSTSLASQQSFLRGRHQSPAPAANRSGFAVRSFPPSRTADLDHCIDIPDEYDHVQPGNPCAHSSEQNEHLEGFHRELREDYIAILKNQLGLMQNVVDYSPVDDFHRSCFSRIMARFWPSYHHDQQQRIAQKANNVREHARNTTRRITTLLKWDRLPDSVFFHYAEKLIPVPRKISKLYYDKLGHVQDMRDHANQGLGNILSSTAILLEAIRWFTQHKDD